MNTALLLATAALIPAQFGSVDLSARMYAAHQAIAPGGRTEIAVEVEIQPEWHIYHRIPFGPGIPTTFKFKHPEGVIIGEARYPTPTLGDMAGIEFLGYAGKVTFLVPLEVGKDVAAGQDLTIEVAVDGLACKESCVLVGASARLKLRVAAEMGKPINEKAFKKARDKMPVPLADAPYIKGSRLLLSQNMLRPGDEAELVAIIQIEKGLHVNHRDPGLADLIPSRLFIESIDGLKINTKAQQWPEPHEVDLAGIGKARQQKGTLVIRTPIKLTDAKFPLGETRLRVLFQYQACNDQGVCYMPQMAEAFVTVQVVAPGSPVTKSNDAIFAAASASEDNGATVAETTGGGGGNPISLPLVFLAAFIGGAILNIMPCVLPVISLKIFGFMQQAGENRARVFLMGLVYAAGIMASFFVLAVVMAWFGLAWGGIMQNATYITVLSAGVLAFALSLFGVFEVQLPGSAVGAMSEAGSREGYGGSFMNGIFATALATPCTAPILAPALGVLTRLSPPVMVAGIMTVGLGLAAPYVLLTAFPAWLRYLPKPGNWMIVFKQFMGFVLLGTVVWLLWVLFDLVEKGQFFTTLAFFCAVGIACWMIGRIGLNAGPQRRVITWVAAIAVLFGGWLGPARLLDKKDPDAIQWQAWQAGLPEELSAQGYTVYVDFTATWCLTCQSNKATVLETTLIRGKLRELNVIPIKADFTKYDPAILAELRKYDRNGVPLNIIFPAGNPTDVIVLPAFLTRQAVTDALEKAGASKHAFNSTDRNLPIGQVADSRQLATRP